MGDKQKETDSFGVTRTVSVAIGASCIENAQSQDLVLDDGPKYGNEEISAASALFARVLQFMETPQYLRKALIPMHPDLKEGVVWGFDEGLSESIIDIGLTKYNAVVDSRLPTGVRVTLYLGPKEQIVSLNDTEYLRGYLSNPLDPKSKSGKYWGYSVRLAKNIDGMLHDGPFEGGYDLTIGTSERGEQVDCCSLAFPNYKHALIVIGGPQGLEYCLETIHCQQSILSHRLYSIDI
eukprot:jgi/Picre1/31267/NNA_006621.t1